MIELKSTREISRMREAGRLVALAHREVQAHIRPGVATLTLDHVIRDFVRARDGKLLFLNYSGFPAHSCISINEEVVHGIPSPDRQLRDGDIVSVDIGVGLAGYCGDSAWTYPVGDVSEEASALLAVGSEALAQGIGQMVPNRRVSDISRSIQAYVEARHYSVVRKYVGHGIGRRMHEPPQVPNYVDERFLRDDPVLQVGMVLAIEPMVNVGTAEVVTLSDKWTVITKDRRLSVHFEHTVAVTENGPEILTLP